jgi:hypothetical protein
VSQTSAHLSRISRAVVLFGIAMAGAAGAQDLSPCLRDADTACLLAERFEVGVAWTTSEASGEGRVMSFAGARAESDQSAFFWFFDPANFEMGVKMVDACDAFGSFWVFVSGLTNQGFDLAVRDSESGLERVYSNPLGTYPQTVGDTSAFPCAPSPLALEPGADGARILSAGPARFEPATLEAATALPCLPDGETACLLAGRFEVRVDWSTVAAAGSAGVMSFAGERAESDQSAFFWFFDPANFEMGVKMVDACDAFGSFWVFVSGLTNQAFDVVVRDSVAETEKRYPNPLGTYPQTVGDTSAFPCP